MTDDRRQRRGTFGDVALPAAATYVVPPRRRRLLFAGIVLAAAFVAYAAFDFVAGGADFVVGGPLSSSHATLEQDCAACHVPFASAASERCATCHEKYGDRLGVYSFASHYLYRSRDFQRLGTREHEVGCAACHREHGGREAPLTAVGDALCTSCHDFGSFAQGHPPPSFAGGGPDPAGLRFPHARHVREVMDRQGLSDLERACLHCHNPQPDGRYFAAIDFDRHCAACHLGAGSTTPRLPVAGGEDGAPGVETLAAVRARGGLESAWAFTVNPGELRQVGRRVSKTPLAHRDAWVLHNLRRLRRELYPAAGLADLLVTSADVAGGDARVLYREAIATLAAAVAELRSRPQGAVRRELASLEALLGQLERRLEDPYAVLDESRFLLPEAPAVDARRAAAIDALAEELTTACRQCHLLRQATLVRVQAEQRTLRRSEFDHRAHILQARCLDCHAAIPIAEAVAGGELPPETADRAAIHNLPSLDVCRGCHQPQLAGDRCTTCHLFHPDVGRRSELLLYLEDADG
ncbi:MAG: hypothetical protein D6696_16595 [Acidobacteria bacterium]|nr:MAG: hypothetical protein D6696_16595 [Acidobacteriota bacterium]